jgi:hypothetical protein
MTLPRPPEFLSGDEALARGAWAEARGAFEAVLRIREIPEALEGLGTAAWWLDLADLVFDSRERAYRLYLSGGDRAGAARVRVWLAWDYWAFRGESAVANGWLQRARRLLNDLPPCPERAWQNYAAVRGAWRKRRHSSSRYRRAGRDCSNFTREQGTTIILYGRGPVEFKYVNPADDPRNAQGTK